MTMLDLQIAKRLKEVGASLVELQTISGANGALSVAEIGKQMPFEVRRYFLVYDVPPGETRGRHAHRAQHQYLTCVRGSCLVMVENGRTQAEVRLDSPRLALSVPPMLWSVQSEYSADAVLLVLSSDVYDELDYIRDYAEFLSLTGAK